MRKRKGSTAPKRPCRSTPIAERGITTAADFAQFMSALLTDLAVGAIDAQRANAMSSVGGKLLKVAEMQEKFGQEQGPGKGKRLVLAGPMRLLTHGQSA